MASQKPAFETFRDILTGLAGFDATTDAALLQEIYAASDQYFAEGIDGSLIPSVIAGRQDLQTIAPNYAKYLGDYQKIRQANVDVTSVSDLNNARNTYKALLRNYGLNDIATNESADKFLLGGVSALEATDRIQTAFNAVYNADAALKEQLKTYYPSLAPADIVGTMLGVGKTVDQLKKEIATAGISAAAATAGYQPLSSTAEELAKQGVTRQQAFEAFAKTKAETPQYLAAAQRAGISTTNLSTELEQENLQTGPASQRRRKIQQAEANIFGGTSGAANVSLTRQGAAGAF